MAINGEPGKYEDYAADADMPMGEYDISAVPSDFNVMMLRDSPWRL